MEKLGETIEQWEREVRDYAKMYKKALDEEIKIGVLAYLAPEKVSEHLFLFANKLQTYADARKKGGKGKDGEGRKHGGPETGKGKDKFAGECWVCGKTGHKT
eukprot:6487403-Amphidinium_carterae.4